MELSATAERLKTKALTDSIEAYKQVIIELAQENQKLESTLNEAVAETKNVEDASHRCVTDSLLLSQEVMQENVFLKKELQSLKEALTKIAATL